MSLVRLAFAGSLVVAFAGCGSSGLGGVLGGINPLQQQCDTGTSVQLASPLPGQTGVNPAIGQIIIVANGDSNVLHNTSSQWDIAVVDQFSGNRITGSSLTPVSDTGGPHPYGSDFYYASNIGQLPYGATWQVQLEEPGANCTAVPLQSFST